MNDYNEQALPCSDKLAFDTRQQAEASATVALHQHGTKLYPYLCGHCALWHLSSNTD
ncbi:MAG TPA: hypothetical protein VLA92_04130 [Candidatus Saccharimonadales bacterium]|nr:hypothetical protein [Candidatus Saccharimonadales bacterium]